MLINLLLPFILVYRASAQDTNPLPLSRFRKCTLDASGCSLQVEIKCTYTDSQGSLKTCIEPGQFVKGEQNKAFFSVPANQCSSNPRAAATITYRLCNLNNQAVNLSYNDESYVYYANAKLPISTQTWDNNLAAGTCREHVIEKSLDLCKSNVEVAVSAQGPLVGKAQPNFCACFMRKYIKTTTTNNPAPVPAPSSPTAPTAPTRPTAPTTNEGGGTSACDDATKAIITEIANPVDNRFATYVEIYFHGCANEKVGSWLKLIRWTGDNVEPANNWIQLNNLQTNKDGFVTVCTGADAEQVYGRDTCTIIGNANDPINFRGGDTIALVTGPKNDYKIRDIFGVPGAQATYKAQDFTNGRAVRGINAIEQAAEWNPADWAVFPGEGNTEIGTAGMDPNEWKFTIREIKTTLIITEIMSPEGDYPVPSFVEIYAPKRSDRGQGTNDNLKLVIFYSDSMVPNFDTAVRLDRVPPTGFITVCNSKASEILGSGCSITTHDLGSPANSGGKDQIAIISGDESGYFVLDIFGKIGEDGFDTHHDFSGSRVVRKLSATEQKSTWSKDDWTIQNEAAFWMGDPNEWKDAGEQRFAPSAPPTSPPSIEGQNCELVITEITDPIDDPINGGYVELMSTCPGQNIRGNKKLITWGLGSITEIDLAGFTVPDDGFIVVCKDIESHQMAYAELDFDGNLVSTSECDIENVDLVTDGFSPVAIIEGEIDDYTVIDNYGYPGLSLRDTSYAYHQGRAVRNFNARFAFGYFNPTIWAVNPSGNDYAIIPDNDPRVWEEVPLNIVFSEFCDPTDSNRNRFIELYSPNKRDYVIKEDLLLFKYEGESSEPSFIYESLRGKKINSDGFLVLCADDSYWDEKCDYVTGPYSVANSDGHTKFALAKCISPAHPSCNMSSIQDVFGRIGTQSDGNTFDFKDGRAVRKDGPYLRNSFWVFNHYAWIVVPGEGNRSVTSSQCDPGMRAENMGFAPTPAPQGGNGGGGGKPSSGGSSGGKPSSGGKQGKSKRIRTR